MCDQNQRRTRLTVHLKQQFDNALTGRVVETARGFICKKQGRPRPERPSQGHTLLFASRQGARIVVEPITQTDPSQAFLRTRLGIGRARQFKGQHHVFQRGHLRQQLKRLKDEPHVPGAPLGAGIFIEREQILAGCDDASGAWPVQSGQQPEQRRLARP